MKDLSYKHIFNGQVSHRDALKERVSGSLCDILMQEKEVSEKSFSQVDDIVKIVKDFLTENIFKICEEMYSDNKRINYIAEFLYDNYLKTDKLNESITTFSQFVKHK